MISPQVISALVVGSVLALIFPGNTRGIGIITTSVLAYFYPVPILMIVLVGVGVFLFKRFFSR